MKVLVACEFSGIVRRAFQERGHAVISADLLPPEDGSEDHWQGDVTPLLELEWDLLIAFPPCTYLCGSGLHWNKRRPERAEQTEKALEFVQRLLNAPIRRIALENPVGLISSRIGKPTQIIQPYDFGEDASKRTCLWLKNLPPLQGTLHVPGRPGDGGRTIWGNQTPSGQNRLGPSEDRAMIRSRTYPGIARAMAEQWG